MKRLLLFGFVAALGACTQGAGDRCNPLRATPDCDPGLSCVYPTGANCGVSYCCAVDTNGAIVDPHPNCQPDPDPAVWAACGLDFSAAIADAGHD